MTKYQDQIFMGLLAALAAPFIYIALMPFIVFARLALGV